MDVKKEGNKTGERKKNGHISVLEHKLYLEHSNPTTLGTQTIDPLVAS